MKFSQFSDLYTFIATSPVRNSNGSSVPRPIKCLLSTTSVSFGPKPELRLWNWTSTYLNKNSFLQQNWLSNKDENLNFGSINMIEPSSV